MKNSIDTKSYTRENSKEYKDLKKLVSKHSMAYTDWEMLHRLDKDILDEMPLDNFLDCISRDFDWYETFLNNMKIRLNKKTSVVK